MDTNPANQHHTARVGPSAGSPSPWARWRWLRWLVIGYLAIVVLMMFLEESMIFLPSSYPDDDWQPGGITFEEVRFEASDGTRLHGWYVPHENPRATILFAHGNAGNLSHRADLLRILHDRVGASVMIFDYRGYGRSEGKPNEEGVLADARAARRWLAQREGIAESDIVMMGRSLGAAVAADLAAEDGARGLVLESTFTSLPDVAAHYYPWLPVRLIMRTRLDSKSKIARYKGPLLISHGEADTIIPIDFGRGLFEAANEPKQWLSFPNRDHNDPQPPEYYDVLIEFLDELP
jgi:fermentation-respiration switch protein FrsA (DUF1100 family)